MRAHRTMGWLGLTAVLLAGSVQAEVVSTESSRYSLILDRNPFSLKDPPAPAPAAPPAVTNPPPVKLNLQVSGISITPEGKQAWLVVPPTPGKNTNALYWKIEEGDEQGSIRVIEINHADGTVTVENGGERAVLSLEEDSPEPMGPATGGAPTARSAARGGARKAIPVPAQRSASSSRVLRGRTANQPGAAGGGSAATSALRGGATVPSAVNSAVGSATSRGGSLSRSVPARTVRTVRTVTPGRDLPSIDPVLQRVIMEEQAMEAEAQGIPMPPLPPMPGLIE